MLLVVSVVSCAQSGDFLAGEESSEARKHRKVIQMIIRRMLEKDGTLLEFTDPAFAAHAGETSSSALEGERRIVLHPSSAVRARFFSDRIASNP